MTESDLAGAAGAKHLACADERLFDSRLGAEKHLKGVC